MLNLVMHCGAKAVDRATLAECHKPRGTETWQPIHHNALLDLVEHTLQGNGLSIVNQAHALARDGARYFGLMEVRNGNANKDYGLVVGLRNSHDQSFPAGLVLGSGVFVCDNLAFSGEVVLARRHTRFIMRDLPHLVERAVGRLGDLRITQDARIETYKNTSIMDREAHDLLIRCVDSRVLPVTRVPHALKEWRTPRHREFHDAGKTAWRLFNSVTESVKGRNLDQLPARTQALHGLVDTACCLDISNN